MAETSPQTATPEPAGWTGGQFSLLRGLVALWLLVRSVTLGLDGSGLVTVLAVLAVVLVLPIGAGWRTRWFALALAGVNGVLAFLVGMPSGPTLASLSAMVEPVAAVGLPVMLAWAPAAPFGSVDAMGRTDPAGDWQLPAAWPGTAAAALAVAYLAGAIYLLTDPAWRLGTGLWQPGVAAGAAIGWGWRLMNWAVLVGWLAFAGIALVSHLRPWVWLAALLVSAVCLAAGGWWWLAIGLVAWHLAAFEPAWLPARAEPRSERIFYDGQCGLCHRWARLVLAEDFGQAFTLAPLQGRTFEQAIPADRRQQLPDSIIVQRADGTLLVRSAAVWHILDRLGGGWRVISWLGRAIPRPIADAGYRTIAALRNLVMPQPSEACPLMPPDLRDRFEM